MMVATTEKLPGREVKEVLGVVFGSCVQTKHLGKDIGAGLRSMVGAAELIAFGTAVKTH